MEQRVIQKNERNCIFFIRESNLDFYFVIPNSKQVNLTLGIFDSVDDEELKKIPEFMDKAIVVPVIDSKVLGGIREGQENFCQYLDKYFSLLINTAYKILTFNHIEVEPQIILEENKEYSLFNQFFVSRYQGRVVLEDLHLHSSVEPISKVDNSIATEDTMVGLPVDEKPLEEALVVDENKKVRKKELGFVSYVLLGVLVAVISLVFLYLII